MDFCFKDLRVLCFSYKNQQTVRKGYLQRAKHFSYYVKKNEVEWEKQRGILQPLVVTRVGGTGVSRKAREDFLLPIFYLESWITLPYSFSTCPLDPLPWSILLEYALHNFALPSPLQERCPTQQDILFEMGKNIPECVCVLKLQHKEIFVSLLFKLGMSSCKRHVPWAVRSLGEKEHLEERIGQNKHIVSGSGNLPRYWNTVACPHVKLQTKGPLKIVIWRHGMWRLHSHFLFEDRVTRSCNKFLFNLPFSC